MKDSNKIFDKSETQGKMFPIGLLQKLGSSVQGGRALRVAYAVCPRPTSCLAQNDSLLILYNVPPLLAQCQFIASTTLGNVMTLSFSLVYN